MGNINTLKRILFILTTTKLLASGADSIVLSTSGHVIEINKSVTLNCSTVYGDFEGVRYYMKLQSGKPLPTIIIIRDMCVALGKDTLPLNISHLCVSSRLFTLEIHNVVLEYHNSSVYCEMYRGSVSNRSADVVFEVAVPVTGAEMLGSDDSSVSLTIIENNATQITCKTTQSYPASNVTWYRSVRPSEEMITEDIAQSTKRGNYHLIITESHLTLNLSRNLNGTSIYCKASNGFGDELFLNSTTLQILVQLSKPEFFVGEKEIAYKINVIKEKILSIGCRSDGYPPPSFFWIHKGNVISTDNLLTIPSTNETHNGTYLCKVNNTMRWKHVGEKEDEISVTILIPPSRPIFYFNGSSENVINHTMYVVKNDSFTVICKSTGVPTPVLGWEESRVTNGTLNEMLVQDDFNRTCHASNEMIETVGEIRSISVKATLDVEVLYPPNKPVIQLHTYSKHPQVVTNIVTVEEFSSFNLTCSAVSTPDVNNYSWTGQVKLYSSKIIIQNINRDEDGLYICHASNLMLRSFGNQQIGQSSKAVSVDILYASEVNDFFVASHKEDSPVITNQKENTTFVCRVDSNPGSSIGVHFKNKLLVYNTNTRNLTHVIRNISCSNAGNYYCSSFNKINDGNLSWKQLTLIVKCPPLPENELNFNVTTQKYVSATLSFTAMDYLDSNDTKFTWQREINASKWETIKNDTPKVKISTFSLQTNLTVVNVTEHYSGNYRVVYNNSVGGNSQMFQLLVADLPDPPTYFDYLKGSLTSTKVTVFWTKGYSGGLRQTFVLNISQTSQAIKYDYINETANENMQHTLTGLSSGTQYQLTLWATNKLGKSLPQTLIILTKERDEHSNLTAPIVGSVSSLVAIITGVLVLFLLYRRRTASAKKSDTEKLVYQNLPFDDHEYASGKKQMKHLPVKTKTQALPVNEKTKDMREKTKTQEETSFQVLQEVDDMPPLYNERTEYYNSAEKIAEIEKIKVSELLPYVLGRGEESFETEYQKLPTELQYPCTFARKPENIAFNRYNGIYPYDHSRVKVEGMPEFFINACYINGYTRERGYIASLGPTKKVTYDFQPFWLMVWNEHSDIIVMLTNLHEPSGMKCEQYWPDYGATKCYGDIQVSADREEVFAEYTVRVFMLSDFIADHLLLRALPTHLPVDLQKINELQLRCLQEILRKTRSNFD